MYMYRYQVSCAGQFIGNHLEGYLDTGLWLHIDMAYPSFQKERATGYGVSLLVALLQDMDQLDV
eukprot:1276-Heterococcus_DN1.PRE.1